MTTTTVLSADTATIVSEGRPEVNWSAVIAGALGATGAGIFLLALGAGFGLTLVPAHAAANNAAVFLTGGALYFLAAQTFAFAFGGHVAGHLLAREGGTANNCRTLLHGLLAWSVAATAASILIALGAAQAGALVARAAPSALQNSDAYWTDVMFHPSGEQAALAPRVRYAQANGGVTSDAVPVLSGPVAAPVAPVDTGALAPIVDARSVQADKDEATRIIGMNADAAQAQDRDHLARLVSRDTALAPGAALDRVNAVLAKREAALTAAANAVRKGIAYAALWTALALALGGLASMAATYLAVEEKIRTRD